MQSEAEDWQAELYGIDARLQCNFVAAHKTEVINTLS